MGRTRMVATAFHCLCVGTGTPGERASSMPAGLVALDLDGRMMRLRISGQYGVVVDWTCPISVGGMMTVVGKGGAGGAVVCGLSWNATAPRSAVRDSSGTYPSACHRPTVVTHLGLHGSIRHSPYLIQPGILVGLLLVNNTQHTSRPTTLHTHPTQTSSPFRTGCVNQDPKRRILLSQLDKLGVGLLQESA